MCELRKRSDVKNDPHKRETEGNSEMAYYSGLHRGFELRTLRCRCDALTN